MPVAGPAEDSVKISEQEPIAAATGSAEDQSNAKMSEEEKQNLLTDLTKASDMIAQSDMPFAARMILKVSCNALTAAVKSGNEPAAEHINRVSEIPVESRRKRSGQISELVVLLTCKRRCSETSRDILNRSYLKQKR